MTKNKTPNPIKVPNLNITLKEFQFLPRESLQAQCLEIPSLSVHLSVEQLEGPTHFPCVEFFRSCQGSKWNLELNFLVCEPDSLEVVGLLGVNVCEGQAGLWSLWLHGSSKAKQAKILKDHFLEAILVRKTKFGHVKTFEVLSRDDLWIARPGSKSSVLRMIFAVKWGWLSNGGNKNSLLPPFYFFFFFF